MQGVLIILVYTNIQIENKSIELDQIQIDNLCLSEVRKFVFIPYLKMKTKSPAKHVYFQQSRYQTMRYIQFNGRDPLIPLK